MSKYSTRQAAKKLGIGMTTLSHYIEVMKVPAPKPTIIGRYEVRAWSESDIEKVREIKLRSRPSPDPGRRRCHPPRFALVGYRDSFENSRIVMEQKRFEMKEIRLKACVTSLYTIADVLK
jgi:predicted DNA-binding transcriptional regulator AlpA